MLVCSGAAGNALADGVGQIVGSYVAQAFERNNPDTLLGDDGAGLKRLLAVPIRAQIEAEFAGTPIPPDISVVFGHTHKPFQQSMAIDGFLAPQVHAWNSGGWVVDCPAPQPLIGGAVILMDEDLNFASLRMYNEAEDARTYAVSIAAIDGAGPNALFDRLAPMVDPRAWPWKDFSAAAAMAVAQHTERVSAFLDRASKAVAPKSGPPA